MVARLRSLSRRVMVLLGVALASSAQAQVINTPGQTIYTFTSPGTVEDTGLVVGRNQGGLVWIYGMRSDDGNFGGGTIFRLQVTGTDFEVLHQFGDPASPDVGFNPSGPLIEGATGIFYGTTREGGTDGWGGVFRLDTTVIPPVVTVVHSFSADQGVPHGGVTLASDGMLYGTASSTYATPDVVYRIATDGTGYQQLYMFPGSDTDPTDPGRATRGVIEGSDGLLYGATWNGPDLLRGKVFRMAKDGTQFEVLAEAPGQIIAPPVEIESSGDRWIYVVTADGPGTFPTDAPNGSIFRVLPDGSYSERVHTFDPTIFDLGAPPTGRIVRIPGQNGVYGLTSYAGGACINGFGCGSVYRAIGPNPYPLRVVQNNENSIAPQGTPALMPDGRLVVMTAGRFDLTTIDVVNYPATDPLELTGPASVQSTLQNYGVATYEFNVAHRNLSTRPLTSLQVHVDTSSALQLSGQASGNGWSCVQPDPNLTQYICTWAGTLNSGDTTPAHTMSFAVSPFGSFAPNCGTTPTPCVTFRADLVSAGTILANATATTAVTVVHPNTGLPNTAPIANDDSMTVMGVDAVNIRVLDNDYSNPTENDFLSIEIITQPSQGYASPGGNLTIDYFPNAPLTRPDTFHYRLTDTFGASDVATVTLSPPQGFTLSKTFIDIGNLRQGEAATARLSVVGPANAGGLITFEPVPPSEIAALFQQYGSPHDPLAAVFDPDAFRPRGSWDTLSEAWIYYRASASYPPGRVSVVRAVFTDVVTGTVVGSAVLVGESADPVTGPQHAVGDTAQTALGTPVAVDVVANDVPSSAEPQYVGAVTSCVNYIEFLFDGAVCAPVPGTERYGLGPGTRQVTFEPLAGFSGTSIVPYASGDLPACPSTGSCRQETTLYWSTLTITVGGATPPNLVATKVILDQGAPVSTIEALNGDTIVFRVGAVNQPPAGGAAIGATTDPVTVTDTLPVGLAFVPAQSDARCSASGQVVTCTSPVVLNQGDAVTFNITTTVVANPGPGNAVALYNDAVAATAAEITTADNISPYVQVMVRGLVPTVPPNLRATKAILDGSGTEVATIAVMEGAQVQFRIGAVNDASAGDTSGPVTVIDTLPAGLSAASVDGRCTVSGQAVTCVSSGLLAPGGSVAFDIIATTATGIAGDGSSVTVQNQATASTSGDSSPADNVSPAVAVTILGPRRADLAVTMAAAPTSLLVGETVTFTAVVTNGGPNDAQEVRLRGFGALLNAFSIQSVVPSQGGCGVDTSATVIECSLVALASGASATITVNATPMPVLFPGNASPAMVGVSAEVTTVVSESSTSNNQATTTLTVSLPPADVVVNGYEVSQVVGGFVPGLVGTLTLDVTVSRGAAVPVAISFTLPTGLTLDGNGGSSCVAAGSDVSCDVSGIVRQPEAVRQWQLPVRLQALNAALPPGAVRAEYTMPVSLSAPGDPTPGNNSIVVSYFVERVNGDTPVGQDIAVPAVNSAGTPMPVTVTFSAVTGGGQTVANPITTPPVPSGFQIASVAYDITTTATFTPPVTVCIDGSFGANDYLLHYESGAWVQLPNQQRLPAGGPPFTRVCADTATFSPFVVATRVNRAPTVDAGPNQTIEATSASGAIVSVNGSATDLDGDTLTYTWSGACGAASGASAALACPLGTNEVTLSVSDGENPAVTDTLTITVRDTIAPQVACGGADGVWHASNQTVSCTATDAVGVAAADASFTLETTVPAGTETTAAQTGTRAVCDAAGNCSTAGPIGPFRIDRRGPGITLTAPANNASYTVGQAVTARFSCSDGGSGVQTCQGTLADGATIPMNTPGTYTFTVDAVDQMGNTSRTSVTYTVRTQTFTFTGFLWPVQNPPVVNKVKAGSAIPIRFSLGGDFGLDVLAPGFPQVVQVACGTGLPEGEVEETVAALKSGLIYNPFTKRYIYVWKTDKSMAGGCWQLTLRFTDGTSASALFKIRR